MSEVQSAKCGVSLRLFVPREGEGDGSLSAESTLREFFELWYVPIILKADGVKEQTVDLYRKAIDWWEQITGNPPLRLIDDYCIANFAAGLRVAKYRRGKAGPLRDMSPTTAANHLRYVRTMLAKVGPRSAVYPITAGLLEESPYVPRAKRKPKGAPKPPFTTDQWPAVFIESRRWEKPHSHLVTAPLFWQALFCLLFYTGFRIGTCLRLRWEHVVQEQGAYWIDVPSELVDKTEKATKRIIHGSLLAALQLVEQPDMAELVPFGVHEDTLAKWHKEIQAAAGIAHPLGWNAWRRTHSAELARPGYDQTVKLLQHALDHSDASTTTTHYYDPVNEFVRRLPAVEIVGGEKQLWLF